MRIKLKSLAVALVGTVCIGAAACSDSDDNLHAPKPEIPDVLGENPDKPMAMWIDTEANYELFSRKVNIDAELEKIKRHGLNMIYIDVKPSNGYALYKSDILPYCYTFANHTVTRDYDDYLGYVIEKCEELGIDVVASISATVWGWHRGDQHQGLIYDQWEKWGDKVQVRSDDNNPDVTIPITEDPLQEWMLLDPVFPEVQDLIVSVCKEIVTKYPKLKGLSIDYLRYNNNDGGWFGMGDANMEGYAKYWNERVPGHLEIVTSKGGVGPKFANWIEYRSAVITETLGKIRDAVKSVRPECELHMWASAEWGSRYCVGQNWASKRYIPTGAQYTNTYHNTGFADLLDVFVTGAYSDKVWKREAPNSEWTVENFCTTWNKYIMGDCKCYGSLAAYALNPVQHSDATYLCLKHTDGYMTFELSHVNNRNLWMSIVDGIERYKVD